MRSATHGDLDHSTSTVVPHLVMGTGSKKKKRLPNSNSMTQLNDSSKHNDMAAMSERGSIATASVGAKAALAKAVAASGRTQSSRTPFQNNDKLNLSEMQTIKSSSNLQ